MTLNPNLAMAWGYVGAAPSPMSADLAEADRRVLRYRRLLPPDQHASFFYAVLYSGGAAEARARGGGADRPQVSEMNWGFWAACRPYLAALGHLGRRDEVAQICRRLLAIAPGFSVRAGSIDASPFARDEDRQVFTSPGCCWRG